MTPPLRVAAVGCGRVFERFHLPALQQSADWALVGAVDPAAERLRWLGRLAPGLALGDTLADLDTDRFDAVLISSPPDTHCALAAEALRRGAHVLVEKPLALSPAEAASLLELAREHGLQIWVGFNRRFRPAYARLREQLQALPAGRLREVSFELRASPSAWEAVSDYLHQPERGGGLLDDLASHQLDLVPWMVSRRVEQIRARLERVDSQAVVARIDLRLAGGVSGRCLAVHGGRAAECLEIRLTDRTLVAGLGAAATSAWVAPRLARRYVAGRTRLGSALRRLRGAPGFAQDAFRGQLGAWAAALRGGQAPLAADGAAGARCVALVEGCRQSLAVGGAWVVV